MAPTSEFPVHESISVESGVTIYRTDQWWKAAVKYSIDEGEPVVAIYLWLNDDGEWKRKQKYTINSKEDWLVDKTLVEHYLPEEDIREDLTEDFPVSDYYNVAVGETVMKTEDWWKAVVVIDRKGSYECHEVIIYLWQNVDDSWRRRQKYSIKRPRDWADDRLAVEELLELEDEYPVESLPNLTDIGESPIVSIAKELGIELKEGDPSNLVN